MSAASDTDQDFIQQNCLQMQEKHNARLGPKSQTTFQMQLNEGQYVMSVSNQMPLMDLHVPMEQ